MREDEPRDPSLAMCQICAYGHASAMTIPDQGNDGQIRHYRACARYVLHTCNDFVPVNNFDLVKGGMESRANYGRLY